LVTVDVKQPLAEVLHLPSRQVLLSLEPRGQIAAATLSPRSDRLLLATGSGDVELWRFPFRIEQRFAHEPREGRFSSLYAARFDRSGHRVLTSGYDGSLRVWDRDSGSL